MLHSFARLYLSTCSSPETTQGVNIPMRGNFIISETYQATFISNYFSSMKFEVEPLELL